MFVLALIHTFPFIVVNIREGIMEVEWRMSVFWWTGVAALVCQGYLTIMSYPWIRYTAPDEPSPQGDANDAGIGSMSSSSSHTSSCPSCSYSSSSSTVTSA